MSDLTRPVEEWSEDDWKAFDRLPASPPPSKTLRQLVDEWRAADEEFQEHHGMAGRPEAISAAITLARRVSACTDPLLIAAVGDLLRDLPETRRLTVEEFADLDTQTPPRAAALAVVVLDTDGRSYVHTAPPLYAPPSLERHALAGAVAGLADVLGDSIERHVLDAPQGD